MRRWLPVLLAAPGVLLGVVGTTHPMHLTPGTAHHWWVMHVAGLFVFPLVGVALAWLVRGRRDVLAIAVVVASYAYATCYTALDVINGVAAGYVTDRLGPGVARPEEVSLLFRIGGPLGDVGAWGLFAAAVLLSADVVRRAGLAAAAPAVLLVVGAWFVRTQHIFPPYGALGCVAIGVATGWFGWLLDRDRASREG